VPTSAPGLHSAHICAHICSRTGQCADLIQDWTVPTSAPDWTVSTSAPGLHSAHISTGTAQCSHLRRDCTVRTSAPGLHSASVSSGTGQCPHLRRDWTLRTSAPGLHSAHICAGTAQCPLICARTGQCPHLRRGLDSAHICAGTGQCPHLHRDWSVPIAAPGLHGAHICTGTGRCALLLRDWTLPSYQLRDWTVLTSAPGLDFARSWLRGPLFVATLRTTFCNGAERRFMQTGGHHVATAPAERRCDAQKSAKKHFLGQGSFKRVYKGFDNKVVRRVLAAPKALQGCSDRTTCCNTMCAFLFTYKY
jgi:hypothetical protein